MPWRGPPILDVEELLLGNAAIGIVLHGAGAAVSAVGDLNLDGLPDVLIGDHLVDKVYVLYGRASQSDADGDGLADYEDNCLHVRNPEQRDTDEDSIGNAYDADLDQSCLVDVADLSTMKDVFFSEFPDADFSGDGAVNFSDLVTMKRSFGSPPGPSGLPNACAEN